jgi:hypothetical protein
MFADVIQEICGAWQYQALLNHIAPCSYDPVNDVTAEPHGTTLNAVLACCTGKHDFCEML